MAERRTIERRPRPGPTGVQLGEEVARSRILQGAAVVLARQGARLCSVQDILAQSGVSRRTFYRFYQGKDEVMLALYRLGTEGLLAQCRAALSSAEPPRRRFERCIDAHLANALGLSRLVYVLGGEAQHHESPLYARRREVHDELVVMLTRASRGLDPMAARALVLTLEGLVRFALERADRGGAMSPTALAQIKRALEPLYAAVL